MQPSYPTGTGAQSTLHLGERRRIEDLDRAQDFHVLAQIVTYTQQPGVRFQLIMKRTDDQMIIIYGYYPTDHDG
jgi:hypothetical protein